MININKRKQRQIKYHFSHDDDTIYDIRYTTVKSSVTFSFFFAKPSASV